MTIINIMLHFTVYFLAGNITGGQTVQGRGGGQLCRSQSCLCKHDPTWSRHVDYILRIYQKPR